MNPLSDTENGGDHPSVDDLLGYYHREVSAATHGTVEAHLRACEPCRQRMSHMDRLISSFRRSLERRPGCPPIESSFPPMDRRTGSGESDAHSANCPPCLEEVERFQDVMDYARRGRAHFPGWERPEVPGGEENFKPTPQRFPLLLRAGLGVLLLGGGYLAFAYLRPSEDLPNASSPPPHLEPLANAAPQLLIFRYGASSELFQIAQSSVTGLWVKQAITSERPSPSVFRVGSPPGDVGLIALQPPTPLTELELGQLKQRISEIFSGPARYDAEGWADARAELQGLSGGGVWLLNAP